VLSPSSVFKTAEDGGSTVLRNVGIQQQPPPSPYAVQLRKPRIVFRHCLLVLTLFNVAFLASKFMLVVMF
jgi:hypothetical protein